jgi:biopolymer transport protein ExbB
MVIIKDFFTLMQAGTSWIMWPLFAIGVVIWSVGLERFVFLGHIEKARTTFLLAVSSAGQKNSIPIENPHFKALLNDLHRANETTGNILKTRYRQFLISMIPDLEKGFSTMTAWIYVSPLMGLLGTVIGMIETFKSIMLFGTNNPSVMAEGISVALLTTQAGLIVAFPALVLQVLLVNRKNRLVSALLLDGERLGGS